MAIDEVVQSDLEIPAGSFVMGVCYTLAIPFSAY
jgi:hypothetical protein